MKKKLHIAVLLFSSLLILSSSKHPIKLTSSEIKYDTESHSISIACKVYIDDFSSAISSTLQNSILNSNVTEGQKELIEFYFNTKYKISINGKKVPFKFNTYSVEYNVMNIEFSKNYMTLKKGDKIYIENELLFEAFGPMQSNWVTLEIPPFLSSFTFESKMDDSSYAYTF